MTDKEKDMYLEFMNELAKKNIPAIILIQEKEELHYVRNCEDNVTARIVSDFLDTNDSVQEQFVNVLEKKTLNEIQQAEAKEETEKLIKP